LQKVLPLIFREDLANIAKNWLRGAQLSENDLKKLDLPPGYLSTDFDREKDARSVVLSLLQLAGDKTTLFFFFDEVEAIQAGNYDAPVLRQFATLATELLGEPGPRVVATSIRPMLQIAFMKAVEVSNQQKLTQFTAQIPALKWEQAVRIVLSRLDAEPTCRPSRQKYFPEKFWPLGEKFVDGVVKDNRLNLTPRHLIKACRDEFARLQKNESDTAPVTPTDSMNVVARRHTPDPETVETLHRKLAQNWSKHRKKFLANSLSVQFDTVFKIALPWLAGIADLPIKQLHESNPKLGDVNLVFQTSSKDKKAIGVSLCNHEPTHLWRRLNRLSKQWNGGKSRLLTELVILRSEVARTTPIGEEKLERLRSAGARIIRLHTQQLAELTAFQVMLTATLEGEMIRNGKPVESTEYDDWACANLSESTKDFLDEVFQSMEPITASPRLRSGKKRIAVTE
jgi:hypothetical protein